MLYSFSNWQDSALHRACGVSTIHLVHSPGAAPDLLIFTCLAANNRLLLICMSLFGYGKGPLCNYPSLRKPMRWEDEAENQTRAVYTSHTEESIGEHAPGHLGVRSNVHMVRRRQEYEDLTPWALLGRAGVARWIRVEETQTKIRSQLIAFRAENRVCCTMVDIHVPLCDASRVSGM